MPQEVPDHAIEFLGKSFPCEEVTLLPGDLSGQELVVKASPRLTMRWKGFFLASAGKTYTEYEPSEGNQTDPPPSIELDGYGYPILRATVRPSRSGASTVVEINGIAECVEYEGCDEVARPTPFRAVFTLPDS